MNGWIKLTAGQAAQLQALTASNPGPSYLLQGTVDAGGDSWLSADCLQEAAGIFAHYAPLLSTLTVTQQQSPTWPSEP
jgi:hypothetical protein